MDENLENVSMSTSSIQQDNISEGSTESIKSDPSKPKNLFNQIVQKLKTIIKKETPRIDFILVYEKNQWRQDSIVKIEKFLENLTEKGFQLESITFTGNEDIVFVKIYAPKFILLRYADIFGIELAFQAITFKSDIVMPFQFMKTPITDLKTTGTLLTRMGANIPGEKPNDLTSAERSLITYKVLLINAYGDGTSDYGIEKLLSKGVFECAYPLHDGSWKWTEEGPLNDRQLLTQYWSNFKCWYKMQPLDLIERYYGPGVAFYFAWLGFYNKMLVPVAIIGTVFFLGGIGFFWGGENARSEEVCDSDQMMCPRCIVKNCQYQFLKGSCTYTYLTHFVDNPLNITFAAIISIWATIFIVLWGREETVLQMRWNLRSVETDFSVRPEFEENVKYRRYSSITEREEPYVPRIVQCWHFAITFSVILLLIIVVLLGLLGVMIYIVSVSAMLTKSSKDEIVTKNVNLIATSTGSIMSVVFILLFELLYDKVSLVLTNFENPRTQTDFDNSYTFKSYALAFVNNYSVVFYIAFFKSKFYTFPGDNNLFQDWGGIGSDLCDPSGCIINLGIQIFIHMTIKTVFFTLAQYFEPWIRIVIKKIWKRRIHMQELTPAQQWEEDYMLNDMYKYHLMEEYMQMIIQYGFVTFFVAAFPLSPLLALINNTFELRVDALKFTSSYRRPIAIKVANLGAFRGILRAATIIGIATNAFVIAFTTEFIEREVYRHSVDINLIGYINSTLSVFSIDDYPTNFREDMNITKCFYSGYRYPPEHPRKYQIKDSYWYLLAMKFAFIVIFEHVLVLISGIISYTIPEMPFSVKEQIKYQREQMTKMKMKALNEKFLKNQKGKRKDVLAEV